SPDGGRAARQGPPLRVVERQVRARLGRQQRGQLHAQDTRAPVQTLDGLAQLEEPPRLVARERVVDRPQDREQALLGGGERGAKGRQVRQAAGLVRLQRVVRLVDGEEGFERQPPP